MNKLCRSSVLAVLVAGCGDNLEILAFHKQTIDRAFRAEGVAVFDVDHDGDLDVVTQELWYAAPTFAPIAPRNSPAARLSSGRPDSHAMAMTSVSCIVVIGMRSATGIGSAAMPVQITATERVRSAASWS